MSSIRPNIVFIMADDHTCSAISAYGSQIAQTPGIDRLAAEGLRFDNCVDVNALCAPSRATILSGKYSHANGFHGNGDTFDGSQTTFPKLLQEAGYATSIIGKWHLVSEPTGFDYYNVLPGHGRYWNPRLKEKGDVWEDGNRGGKEHEGYLTDIITDQTINWLASLDQDRPFCCMVHHKAPHTPHEYPGKYAGMYEDVTFPEPDTLQDDYAGRKALEACDSAHSKYDEVDEARCRRWACSSRAPRRGSDERAPLRLPAPGGAGHRGGHRRGDLRPRRRQAPPADLLEPLRRHR